MDAWNFSTWICLYLKETTGLLNNKCQKFLFLALSGVAQWIEHRPVTQRVTSLIPSTGHRPGLWAQVEQVPGWGSRERQPHVDVSLLLFLLPFPSL